MESSKTSKNYLGADFVVKKGRQFDRDRDSESASKLKKKPSLKDFLVNTVAPSRNKSSNRGRATNDVTRQKTFYKSAGYFFWDFKKKIGFKIFR